MFRRLSGAAGLAALLAGHAVAQEAAAPPQATTGELQVFEPAYFVQYAPNTAQDMVSQVPGFSIQEGDAVRGFGGSAGNILINGNRPSTKGSLTALLSRIPFASVIRAELVTGASATLDMRGQTKVVNVIVRENALAERFNEPPVAPARTRIRASGSRPRHSSACAFVQAWTICSPPNSPGPAISMLRTGPLSRVELTHSSNGVQPFVRVSGKF